MIRNSIKLLSGAYKCYKDKKKEAEEKLKGNPNFKVRDFMSSTEGILYEMAESSIILIAEMGKSVAMRLKSDEFKSIFDGFKALFNTVKGIVGAIKENHAVNLIIDTEKEFRSAISHAETKNQGTDEEKKLTEVLKDNSLL